MDSEIVEAASDDAPVPRRGTLAWVKAQGTVDRNGEAVPACNRIPVGAELAAKVEGDRRCRVLNSDARCKAPQAGDTGLCAGHAGVGGVADLDQMRKASNERRASLKMTRQMLGIGSGRTNDPRAAARIRAALRADDLAKAVVDGPLDADLKPLDRQRAALAAIDATYPLQTVTAELSLSADTDVDAMDWATMQRIALSLQG